MAGQRQKQYHGLRRSRKARFQVHHGVGYWDGPEDIGEDAGCCVWERWGDVIKGVEIDSFYITKKDDIETKRDYVCFLIGECTNDYYKDTL